MVIDINVNKASEYIHIIVKKTPKNSRFLKLLGLCKSDSSSSFDLEIKEKSTCLYNTVERVFFRKGVIFVVFGNIEKNPKITIFQNVSQKLSNRWFHGTTAHAQTK